MNTTPVFFLAAAVQLLAAVTLHAQAPALSPVMPVDPPNGKNSTQSDWNNFGWQSFVAANWPAVAAPAPGISGQPDASLPVGALAKNGALVPTTWLTWRTASSTFLAKAVNPGPWNNNPQGQPPGCAPLQPSTPVAPGFLPMMLNMTTKLSNPIDDIDEAFAGPLIDQSGWCVIYDIRLNQSEYTYIQQFGYYDAVNQQKAFPPAPAKPTFIGFPRTGQDPVPPAPATSPPGPPMFNPPLPAWAQFGATEIKASWRVLDPTKDQISRYYTQTGYFLQPDGTTCQGPTIFGLIGLHILRLTPSSPSTWFWATFEQVDNVSVPEGATFKPTLALPNTPIGNCPSGTNVQPNAFPKNIPWNGGASPIVNVCRVNPIPSDIQAANAKWQQALAGTVWANYQMIGVINPSVPGGPQFKIPVSGSPANTDTLANATLETYFQDAAPGAGRSCMDCHGTGGFPQGAPRTGDFQVFTFLLGNADSSNPGVAKRQGLHRKVVEKFRAAAKK